MSKIIQLKIKQPELNLSNLNVDELVNVVSEMSNILTLIQKFLDQSPNRCQ